MNLFQIFFLRNTSGGWGGGLSHLHSGLRQVDLQRHLLPHEDVRVARLGEQRLQDVELRPREGGAFPALLPRVGCGRNMTTPQLAEPTSVRKFTGCAPDRPDAREQIVVSRMI